MEQIRAERQRHHASSVHRDGVGGTVGDGGAVGDGARLAERCRAEVDTAVRAADALERELGELERATERAVQGGVASAMGAAVPKDVAFLHLGDRLEKALISLDGVDTGGEDDLRALRKGAVRPPRPCTNSFSRTRSCAVASASGPGARRTCSAR